MKRILIVDMNWRKGSLGYHEFVLPIVAATGKADACVVRHYSEVATGDVRGCDKIILSGAALKDCAYLGDVSKFMWLTEVDVPVLGICAGMQIIGAVFGSDVGRCREIGMTDVETIGKNPLFSGKFSAYELHNRVVDVPRDFCVLAKSKLCVQGMKHKSKEIYGVLFHPEVRNREIIERFVGL